MRRYAAPCITLILVAVALFLTTASAEAAGKGKFSVGSKEFTEQLILGHMASLIMKDAGYDVVDRIPLGGTNVVRQALLSKQIDGYIEYTGTGTIVFMKDKEIRSPEKTYELIKTDDAKRDIIWLPPMPNFNNTYCLMMRKDHASELGIKSMSDLAAYVNANPGKLKVTVNNEFFVRPDGLTTMIKTYGFKLDITTVTQMDSGLIYLALKDKKCDVGIGFSTDGRIAAYAFVPLLDDRQMFPAYNPCFVLHKSFYDKDPSIAAYFEKLALILNDETITELNFRAAEKKEDPRKLAEEFLKKNGIIR